MVLTIIYITLLFLRPDYVFPEANQYHVMLWLGVVAAIASVPRIQPGKLFLRAPQTFLLLAFLAAIICSELASLWFGGVIQALDIFFPSVIAFVLVALNVTTMKRVRILVGALILISAVLIGLGVQALRKGSLESPFIFVQRLFNANDQEIGTVLRLTGGSGYLQDPNDFAQYLLTLLPLIFASWQKTKIFRNVVVVLLPAALFFYAIYLTHSRGALVGMAVLLLFALRPKLGNVGSGLATIVLVLGLLAMNFSGGRAISISSGSDRLEAWSTGLQIFKQSPIFGVGFNRFTEYNQKTAHNSFVLCLAELGIVGFTIWLMLLTTTIIDLNRVIAAGSDAQESPPDSDESGNIVTEDPREKRDVTRWAWTLRLSLVGFIATAWFLSRTYVPTLYIMIGLSVALTGIAGKDSSVPLPERRRWAAWALGLEFAIIAFVYVSVRMR